ncbi:MAG: hypothetical protein J3R72DRAFT_463611 [Linnemannia gamsii]|nr:MAG: hypothetical protein J3R72DRAFT_463611 [Linnemannia gamsii]
MIPFSSAQTLARSKAHPPKSLTPRTNNTTSSATSSIRNEIYLEFLKNKEVVSNQLRAAHVCSPHCSLTADSSHHNSPQQQRDTLVIRAQFFSLVELVTPKRSSGQTTYPPESRILRINNTTSPTDNDICAERSTNMREWSDDTTTTTTTIRQTKRVSSGPETPSNAYHNDNNHDNNRHNDSNHSDNNHHNDNNHNDNNLHNDNGVYRYYIPLTLMIDYFVSEYYLYGVIPIFIWICYTWTSLEQRLQPHWVFVVDLVNTIIQRAHTCLVVIGAVASVIGTMMYFFCRPENDRHLDNFLSNLQILIKKPEYRATIIFILVGTYLLCPSCFVFPSNLLSWTHVVVLWALCFVGVAVVLCGIGVVIWAYVLVMMSIMHERATSQINK